MPSIHKYFIALAVTLLSTSIFAESKTTDDTAAYKTPEKAAITLGNGEKNWIVVEGLSRSESTLTFPEVQINGNGWLVMHPFEDGKPNGDKYVAATFLEDGKNIDVPLKVHKGIDTGEMFIVMLHRDSNENGILDFIFVTDTVVMDAPVFEGNTMVAHAIPSP